MMIRTKHTFVFFIILAVALVGLAFYLLLFGGNSSEDAIGNEDPVFVDEEREYSVEKTEPEDKQAAREAIIQKLSDYESGLEDSGAAEREAERDALSGAGGPLSGGIETTVMDTAATTSTGSATSTLPTVSIQVDGMTQAGTQGSYCWDGVCKTTLITDLPYSAHSISASSTLPYSIEVGTEPEQVFVFLREISGTSTPTSRELTDAEIFAGEISMPALQGEYLLFITGVWPGGGEVSNAFKIRTQ